MSNTHLYHHGIKGQKWGVRRFQNSDGSYTSAGKKRRLINPGNSNSDVDNAKAAYKSAKRNYNNSFDKAYGKSYQAYSLSKKKRQANEERWNDVSDKAKALDKAKTAYKTAQTNAKKSAVAEYNKKYNAAEKASNQADKKWKEVNEQYKALGKTKVTRMINAARNKTEAAQKYNKEYNLASSMSDKADAKWREATAAYRQTGRSKAERFLNNVKYDPDLKKNK